MINKKIATLCLLAILPMASNVTAEDVSDKDPEAFKQLVATCSSCHGADGVTTIMSSYPILAGQYASYLEHALKSYRDGSRQNAIMAGFASTLSDDDISDLADWFSSLESPLQTAPRP